MEFGFEKCKGSNGDLGKLREAMLVTSSETGLLGVLEGSVVTGI